MPETKASHPQQNGAHETPSETMFGAEAVAGAVDRMAALHAEWGKQVEAGIGHVHTAIDEGARLAKESLTYGTKLSTAFSNAALESIRNSTEWLRNRR